jgi:hypothetical protein
MIGAMLAQPTSALRPLFFVPLTPELTMCLCSAASTYCGCSRACVHVVPVFMRSAGTLINSAIAKCKTHVIQRTALHVEETGKQALLTFKTPVTIANAECREGLSRKL